MQRLTIRLAGRVLASGLLGMALMVPTAALAAEPSAQPAASASDGTQATDQAPGQPSDGTVVLDPSFVTAPTSTPVGRVLGLTGKPNRTPPPTDAATTRAGTSSPEGLPLLLAVLATICLACARMPDVRRR